MRLSVHALFVLSEPSVPQKSPSFRPGHFVDGVRQFADVHVPVACDHRQRLPAAEPLQREDVAVLGVVPSRPSVPAIMRAEIRNPSTAAGAAECFANAVACPTRLSRMPLIGRPPRCFVGRNRMTSCGQRGFRRR
jgi:hypothetical protein